MSKRYYGDSIKNPYLVLNDGDIPRNFTIVIFDPLNQGAGIETEQVSISPSPVYTPGCSEYPELPEKIVIDAEDIRRLYPDIEIRDDVLAYFVITGMRLAPLQEKFDDQSSNMEPGFYFIGQVFAANYCYEDSEPFIQEYYLDTSKPLQVYLGGRNLSENIKNVVFEFPNGVKKLGRIIKGSEESDFLSEVGTFASDKIVTVEDVWRKIEPIGAELLRINVDRIVKANQIQSVDMSIFDEMTSPGRPGEPFYLTEPQWINELVDSGVQFLFRKMQVIGGSEAALEAVQSTAVGVGVGNAVGGVLGAPIGALIGGAIGAAASGISALANQVNIYTDQYNVFRYAVPVDFSKEQGLPQS